MNDTVANPELKKKMKVSGRVVKTTLAGAIVDIGYEFPGVLHISQVSEDEHVRRIEDALEIDQEIEAWVRRIDKRTGRVELTMIEPLALEWREIKKGMVVKGTVAKVEKYGAFVDIGAERHGLVHISELTHDYIRSVSDVLSIGDEVEVKVLDVNRRRKQIKLSLKALQATPAEVKKEEKEEEEVAPTAMEAALRRAMSQTEEGSSEDKKKTKDKKQNELDDIINRTLESKVKAK
jgi:predicted RNA-binding protein with RPS1 domain